jgi:hypothetical protein
VMFMVTAGKRGRNMCVCVRERERRNSRLDLFLTPPVLAAGPTNSPRPFFHPTMATYISTMQTTEVFSSVTHKRRGEGKCFCMLGCGPCRQKSTVVDSFFQCCDGQTTNK